MGPSEIQLLKGNETFVERNAVKLTPGAFVNPNWKLPSGSTVGLERTTGDTGTEKA